MRLQDCLETPAGKFLRKNWWPVLVVLLGVAALSVQVVMLFGRSILYQPDSASYIVNADAIAKQFDFSGLSSHRTPGYPAFLAFVFWVFGDGATFGLRLMQHLMAIGVIAFVYFTGRMLHPSRLFAWLGAFASCFSLQIWAYADAAMSEMLYCFFASLSLYLFTLYARRKSDWALFLSFMVPALAAYVRPQGQYLIIIPLMLFVVHQVGPRLGGRLGERFDAPPPALLRSLVVLLLGIVVYSAIIAPWMYRNYEKEGHFVFGGSMGINLYSRLVDLDDLIDYESQAVQEVKQAYERDKQRRIEEGIKISPNEGWRRHWAAATAYSRDHDVSLAEADKALFRAGLDCLKKYPVEYLKETGRVLWKNLYWYEPMYVYVPGALGPGGESQYAFLNDVKNSANRYYEDEHYAGMQNLKVYEEPTTFTPVYAALAQMYHKVVAFRAGTMLKLQVLGVIGGILLWLFGARRLEWFVFLCFLGYSVVLPTFLVPGSPRHRIVSDPALAYLYAAPLFFLLSFYSRRVRLTKVEYKALDALESAVQKINLRYPRR